MNWDRVEGNWKQFKGKARQKWGKLTDDDLDVIEGKRTELSGKLQARYGYAKDQVRNATARAVASRGTVTANVYLAGRNPSGLTAFSSAVSTPGNALYGHYLTARQTMARFGPSTAEIAQTLAR